MTSSNIDQIFRVDLMAGIGQARLKTVNKLDIVAKLWTNLIVKNRNA